MLQYGQICKLGEQVERAYTIFPKEQVKVILFDDFISNTRKSYLEILSFLGLEDDGKIEFQKINEKKTYKNYFLQLLVKKQPNIASHLLNKWQFIKKFKNELASRIDKWNAIKITPYSLSDSFHQELADYFRDDVKKLSQLLDRDLMHWVE